MILSASAISEQSKDNPNLDGDYKALLQELKKNKEIVTSSSNWILLQEDKVTPVEVINNNTNLPKDYSSLFQIVESNDLDLFKRNISDIDITIRHDGLNLLHKSIISKSHQITDYLISNYHAKLLLQTFEISVRKLPSNKNILHILTEQGDLDRVKKVLGKMIGEEEKKTFLKQSVLTEVAGQRPRPMNVLHLSSLNGHTDLVEFFIEKCGMKVNDVNNKNDTAILWAARWGHVETVRLLIKLGADLKLENDKGSTPLYWAIRYGFPETVKVLLEEGKANVHQKRKVGLVAPIIVASAMGYSEILQILIDNKADINMKIHSGETALHYACALGVSKCVEVLLSNDAEIDVQNDMGETPLHLSVKGNHLDVIGMLLDKNASMEQCSKDGTSVWHIAIEKIEREETGLDLLRGLCKFTSIKMRHGPIRFPAGRRNPVHIAAFHGSVKAVNVFREFGIGLDGRDEHGNSILHIAARENHREFLEKFISSELVDLQNNNGETALHLACRYDLFDSVKVLLSKAKLSVYNEQGESAIHIASKSSSPELVKELIENQIKAASYTHVNYGDKQGNTILHIAAKHGRSDLMSTIDIVNPKAQNRDGDTGLHIAVRYGNSLLLKSLLETFRDKSLSLDVPNNNGETALHIAASLGKTEHVDILIKAGSNLLSKDKRGNGVLHSLVLASVKDTRSKIDYLSTFNCIVNGATRWWCIRMDENLPDDDTDSYDEFRRSAVLELTGKDENGDDLTVLGLCCKVGAKVILENILNINEVYKLKEVNGWTYDVTNLTPNSMVVTPQLHGNVSNTSSNNDTSGNNNNNTKSKRNNKHKPSCLDLICNMEDVNLSNDILNITPISQLVRDYWAPYRWLFGILMLCHITYMAVLSYYGIQLLSQPNRKATAGLLLIWPLMLLLFIFYHIAQKIYRLFTRRSKSWRMGNEKEEKINVLIRFVNFCIDYLSHIACFGFSLMVIIWVILYSIGNPDQNYPLALAYILGWLFTITFTQGFENVFAFSIMLKYIIIRDITRFLLLYFFVLVAFSLAMHALFLTAPNLLENYPNQLHTIFAVFNMMIGMHSFYEDDSVDKEFTLVDKSVWVLRITYIIYIILATIILLNLLIAMMNDSYTSVKSQEGSTWRVGSVKLALQLEKSVPFLASTLTSVKLVKKNIQYDEKSSRYILTISNLNMDTSKSSSQINDTLQAIKELDNQLNGLRKAYDDLNKRILGMEEKGIGKTLHNFRDAVRVKLGKSDGHSAKARTPRPNTARKSGVVE